MPDNPFRRDEDQAFGKLEQYVSAPVTPAASTQQPTQLAQPSPLQTTSTPQQPIQAQAAPKPVSQPVQPAPKQFGQPQQPQPVQPRQTTMTPTTASTRYSQMIQQNAPQAQAVSSGIAQAVQNPAIQAQRSLDAAQKQFSDMVQTSGLTRNQDRTAELINKASRLSVGQQLTPEEMAELQNIATTKEQFGEGVRDTDFVALQNYVDALGQAQKAKEYAGLTGDDISRQQLLQSLAGDQSYTGGQSLFDSLLAGGTQPAAEQLGALRQNLVTDDSLGKALTSAQETATGARELEQSEIESSYKDIQDMLDAQGTGKLAGLEQQIRDRVASENARVKDLNNRIDRSIAGSGKVLGDTDKEKADIAKLGLTPAQVTQINQAAPDLRSKIVQRLKEVNEQTATSKNEQARLNELYKIGNLVNRQGDKINAQEGSDLGSLLNQKANYNTGVATAAQKETVKAAEQRSNELKKEALESMKVPGYRGSKTPQNARASANDTFQRMLTGATQAKDLAEADKVIKSFKSQAEKINKEYTSKNLPAPINLKISNADIMKQANNMIKSGSGQIVGMYGKLPVAVEVRDPITGLVQIDKKTGRPITKMVPGPHSGTLYKTAEEFAKADPKNFKIVQQHAQKLAEIASIAKAFGFADDINGIITGGMAV